MKTTQLFPKPRKRLRQPSKRILRDELRRAADRIIALTEEAKWLRFQLSSLRAISETAMLGDALRHCGLDTTALLDVREMVGRMPGAIEIVEPEPKRGHWWRRIPILNLLKKES